MKKTIGLLIVLFVTMAVHIPNTALGAEFFANDNVSITNPLANDTYVAGGNIKVSDTVNGDLVVAGGEVIIEGEVLQDLIVTGGMVNLKGKVGDDLRVAGGQVFIDNQVDGDVIVFGGSVSMSSSSLVKGDLIAMGGNISTDGTIEGMANIKGGQIVLDGTFIKEVDVRGERIETLGAFQNSVTLASQENLTIGDSTEFLGNVNFWVQNNRPDFTPYLKNESEVKFDTGLEPKWDEAKSMPAFKEGMQIMRRGMFVSGLILNAFLIGLLMLLLQPWLQKASVRFQTQPLRQFGIGWAYFALVPVAGLLLLVTIIGIPLAIMVFMAYGFGFVFVPALTSIITAQWINNIQNLKLEKFSLYLLALLIYTLVALLESISFVGGIIAVTLSLLAVGSVVSEILAKRNPAKTTFHTSVETKEKSDKPTKETDKKPEQK